MNIEKVIADLKKVDINSLSLEQLEEMENKLIRIRDLDPFWTFVPNDGILTEARKNILRRYLKEEDIPQRVDSQLDVLLCRANIVGDSGGNRSDKTTTGCVKGIIKATGELPGSLMPYKDHFKDIIERANKKFVRGRVTAVDYKQLYRVVIPAWQYWIPKQYLKKGKWEDSYSKEFDLLTLYRNGKPCATVEFLTNQQDVKSSQGGDLDFAIFDEEPDCDKYKETLMRFGTADRLDIEIDWTPTEGLTWATELFHEGLFDGNKVKGTLELFKQTPVCNRYVNPETLISIMDEYAKVCSYQEMKMRLLGEAISLSGLVYGNLFDYRVHVIKPFEINRKDFIVYRGLDPHTVKPSVCVEIAIDAQGFEYVCGTYKKQADTEIIKKDLALRALERNYRLGWTRCDKSADSTIHALGGRNIFQELGRGDNAIPALFTSEKYQGSVHAGVDVIKRLLRPTTPRSPLLPDPKKEFPRLYFFDIPENKELIRSMRTLERDTYTNEDKKGMKDRIAEGKHDAHAAMRYCHQFMMNWIPMQEKKIEPLKEEAYI